LSFLLFYSNLFCLHFPNFLLLFFPWIIYVCLLRHNWIDSYYSRSICYALYFLTSLAPHSPNQYKCPFFLYYRMTQRLVNRQLIVTLMPVRIYACQFAKRYYSIVS
jgi:hypothetical protein